MESNRTIDGERWQKKENSRKITKKTRKTMPKRKILHNFVRHISSHVFRAWSVERGARSVERGAWSVERDGGGDRIAAYGERSARRCERAMICFQKTAIVYFQNSNL